MIHEHEPTEIASAGMDFPLSPEAERELQLELADCPICAERAAAYREQMHLLARLPVIDASEATRQRITAAALSGRTDTRSPMVLLLAASLLHAAALAATAVVGAFLNNREPTELGVVDTSPSPAPASIGAAPVTPPPSTAPTPDPTIVLIDDPLPPGQILDVVTTDLRVRSEPRVADDSELREPLLQPGDRLAVVEGPVIASDYAWFRVIPVASGSAGRTADDLPSGWVASGDHDGTPWVSTAEPECPGSRGDIGDLLAMHRYEFLACFQDTGLTFAAVIDGDPETGWRAVDRVDPAAPGSGLEIAAAQSAPFALSDLPSGHAVVLSGSFDRSSDFDCDPVPIDDAAIADLNCRSTFVLTGATQNPFHADVGSTAVTVTNNLRVRSAPEVSDASARLELLQSGTGVLVLGGPVVRSGYVWYEVAVPSVRTSTGGPLGGWVATASKTGGQWLDHGIRSCPSSGDLSFDQLAGLASPEGAHTLLACLGGDGFAGPVTVEARMRMECSGAATGSPAWLEDPPFTLVLTPPDGGSREIRAARAEAWTGLTCGAPATELTYQLEGHFGDAAAENCRAGPAETELDPVLANRLAVLDCRARFVLDNGFVSGPGPTPTPPPQAPPAP